ncbi:cutinase [Roridomyces roridus]|uniref:cutinase n=1 Tax=Roridomyces roridus TaxID=1738132 RepID=A0AAD7FI69_9AGAR|nr:cutinase [Roridomyces roridus]
MFRALALVTLALTVFATPVAEKRQSCADVIVFFARGTTETAPIGTIVGPPLEAALSAQLGSKTLSFNGVDYPADVAGFLEGGDPAGSTTMAQDLTNAASSCPSAALITVGYSQGAQLVHNSAKQISSSVASRIKAAVTFGDPDNGQQVQGVASNNFDLICHVGDDICAGGDEILEPHLTYGMDTPAAAAFIVARV